MRLVVIPSDPIATYERAGLDWLERYYNPHRMFDEVFALSPLEEGERQAYGMTIRGVPFERMKRAIGELKPDVVRAYGGYWAANAACLGRNWDIPVVVSVHDTNPALFFDSVKYADIVICMSKVVAELAQQKGVAPERIRVLPNRVDFGVFYPIKDQGSLEAVAQQFPVGKHLLHLGRKTEQKNLDNTIRALSLLPIEYSCIFAGLGERGPFVQLARELGVEKRCFWIDSIPNSQLPIWYSWCDCMLTPSRWEGFGIVFIEAAACGAAIVTSDIAPMNEYLRHGESAFLVKDYENPNALAQAVRKVCEQTELRRKLQRGAVEAAQPFEQQRVDAQECDIYREAIALPPLSTLRRQEIERCIWTLKARMMARKVLPARVVEQLRHR